MKEIRQNFMPVILIALLLGCQNRVDIEKEKVEILKLHELNNQALLEENVETMFSVYPEGVLLVSDGKVEKSTRAETEKIFKSLFSSVDYSETGDIEEPIIHVSADGSMAWAITQFRLKLSYQDSTGIEKSFEDLGAELLVYEKRNSQWVLVAAAESHQQ
jgi:ketosteroid isomerase-like protein